MPKEEKQEEVALSMQRAVSIEFIRNSCGFAVKARKGQKSPVGGWDPKLNTKERSDLVIREIEFTSDNLGIHIHGPLVDVDIDTDIPFLIHGLDIYLPPCSHVWGRPSRPRTHRVYQIKTTDHFNPTDFPILRRLKKIDEAKVELRGGDVTRGEYSLLPGSVHPSGESYEWSDLGKARNSLSMASPAQLIRALRLSGALAVLAPAWMEGQRNDLVMALSGFLHRIHALTTDLNEDLFSLNKADSLQFIENLMTVASDDGKDRSSRVKTFHRTWDKADKGFPVTGGTTLAELVGSPQALRKLHVLLTDSPDVIAIEEFTSKFAIWQGPGVVIDMNQASMGSAKPFMSRQNFANSWGHRFITVGDKRRLLADILFSLDSTIRVSGVTFDPGEELLVERGGGRFVNQWSGFAIPPHPVPVTKTDVHPFLDYLWLVVSSQNEEVYRWVLSWIAHIFKEPGNKCKTALVLVGVQGAGKSILGHSVLIPIIGAQHAAATNSVESITQNFNITFDNKLFVQCDEATNNRQRAIANKMKAIITDPTQRIEPKGIDAYLKPNHMRFLFTSNDIEDAVYISDIHDRRYTVVEVSPRYRAKIKEYWEPFVAWCSDTENLAKVHRYLVDFKYDFALISRPLLTKAKAAMQQSSWSTFDKWLAAWLSQNHPLAEEDHQAWYDAPIGVRASIVREEWPEHISMTALTRGYNRFARLHGARNINEAMNEHQVGIQLKRRGLKPNTRVRRLRVSDFDDRRGVRIDKHIRLYSMPLKKDVRDFLLSSYGVDMPDEDMMDIETPDEKEKF